MSKHITSYIQKGVAGRRSGKAKGVVIHNDSGRMSALQYQNWLKNHNLEMGFAHYYIDRHTTLQTEALENMAWHTANSEGNAFFIGYEVCQSLSASEKEFLENEQAVFKQVAKDMKKLNIEVNRNTVRLHKEFSATSCPHRSWDLHGKTVNAVKDYFISQIKKYYNGTATTPEPTPSKQTYKTVTVGKWATNYQTGQKIAEFVKGNKYKVKQEKAVNQSNSKKAFLLDGINSWVLEQDTEEFKGSSNSNNTSNSNSGKWIKENGTFKTSMTLPLTKDFSGNGALIANLKKGDIVKYDAYLIDKNYVWIRQKRGTTYGYMATGNAKNGKRTSYWGTFY